MVLRKKPQKKGKRHMGKYRDKQKITGITPEDGFLVEDESFRAAYPAMAEFMMGDEGTPPEDGKTATLLLFVEEGLFKVCLNDRAQDVSGWASGATFDQVLASLESALQDGTLAWRSRPTRRKRS